MKITRRDILGAIGAGSAIAPFSLRGQHIGSLAPAELLANLFADGDSTKEREGLYRFLEFEYSYRPGDRADRNWRTRRLPA